MIRLTAIRPFSMYKIICSALTIYTMWLSGIFIFDLQKASLKNSKEDVCRISAKNKYVRPRRISVEPKVIYTPNMYVARHFQNFDSCFVSECILTNDSSMAQVADGVVVNPYSLLRKSLRFYWNIPKTPKQYWVFITDESPLNEADKYYDGKLKERFEPLDGLVNYTITYRADSDVDFSYGRTFVKKRPVTGYPPLSYNYAFGRKKLAVAFISHCRTTSMRQDYIDSLKRYIPIDVIGLCGRVDGQCPKWKGGRDPCFVERQYEYKFVIGFENSICKDYITEKTFTWLAYDIVPVVMGGGNYVRDTPPKSVVNAFDFESPKALADYLLTLHRNDQLYNEYFRWKSRYYIGYGFFTFTLCNMCNLIHNPPKNFQVYEKFTKWWVDDANCALGGWKERLDDLYAKG